MSFGFLFLVMLSICPFLIFIIVSAISAISELWVTIITVLLLSFWLQQFFRSFRISTPVFESRAPVGSSHSNNFGFLVIALAMETLCCSPPDNWFGNLFWCLLRPTSFKTSLAFFVFLVISFTISTFSSTVRVGNIL